MTITWWVQLSSLTFAQWRSSVWTNAFWSAISSQTPFPLPWSKFFQQQNLFSSALNDIFSEYTKLYDSAAAQKSVNLEMLRYFDPCQLLVSRAATLLAFISPFLRGESGHCWVRLNCLKLNHLETKLFMSLPVIVCYGPNNSYVLDTPIFWFITLNKP